MEKIENHHGRNAVVKIKSIRLTPIEIKELLYKKYKSIIIKKGCKEMEGYYMNYKEKKRFMFLGLPWTFTSYTITDEIIIVDDGNPILREMADTDGCK